MIKLFIILKINFFIILLNNILILKYFLKKLIIILNLNNKNIINKII